VEDGGADGRRTSSWRTLELNIDQVLGIQHVVRGEGDPVTGRWKSDSPISPTSGDTAGGSVVEKFALPEIERALSKSGSLVIIASSVSLTSSHLAFI